MSRHVKPLAVVLLLPIVVTALSLAGRARWEARWDPWLARQVALQRLVPFRTAAAPPTLAALCGDRRIGPHFAPCATYGLFSIAVGASAIVGGAGLVILGGLLLAGRWCRGSRPRMVRLFRPLLVAAAVLVACLAVGNGLVAVLGIEVGAAAIALQPADRLLGSLSVVLGAAALGWALAVAVVAFGFIRRARISLVGETLDMAQQPALGALLRDVATSVGADPPANVVACLVPWLFVTEMDVSCLDRRVSGRTLCLSLPLARILSVGELRGLLAHDLAHYSREQAPFSGRVVLPLVGVSRALLDAVGRSRGLRAIVSAPPLILMSALVGELAAGSGLDGSRERVADEAAAAAAGREALASGLAKLAAFTPAWHAVSALMQNAAYSDTQYLNVAAVFQEIAVSNAGGERLAGVESVAQGHPTDLHPALGRRLDWLGMGVRDIASAALATAPEPSGASLVEGCELVERRLSTAEHQLIVETGGRIARA